jgi:curved DNA-binding protein CbpA
MFMIDLGAASHYSILGVLPDAEMPEIREAQNKKFRELELRRLKTGDPDERRILEAQIRDINSIGDTLSNPAARQKYDRDNAHLTFFVIRRAAAPVFDERDLRLEWVHRAVRQFLEEKGEQVDPLTDLERTDFSADYTENALLNRMLKTDEQPGRPS